MNALTAISPIDGRYGRQTAELSAYFSEYALMRYRVRVEVEYFIALCRIPLEQLSSVDEECFDDLCRIWQEFSVEDAGRIKDIERTTNHDVKAVEYFLKEKFAEMGLGHYAEFIHFGLTSQDINNTAIPLALKEAVEDVYLPELLELEDSLRDRSSEWKDVAMLARTHGQPASPTRMGKEIAVFTSRLDSQTAQLQSCIFPAKFGGATGNLNAHYAAYPEVDWNGFADEFISGLGLHRSWPTTQIDHYDNLAAIFDVMARINTILLDLSRDIWMYISLDYFGQTIAKEETGSSTMPHKVNPIDFENAEGNLGIANAIFGHLSAKLPISRLQRDLSDSTVLRNIGVPVAHTIIAFKSLEKGLGKLILHKVRIDEDLDDNWAVISEGIQTILRREGYPKPYEALKALTRTGTRITRATMEDFIHSLNISEDVREELLALTPHTYLGIDL